MNLATTMEVVETVSPPVLGLGFLILAFYMVHRLAMARQDIRGEVEREVSSSIGQLVHSSFTQLNELEDRARSQLAAVEDIHQQVTELSSKVESELAEVGKKQQALVQFSTRLDSLTDTVNNLEDRTTDLRQTINTLGTDLDIFFNEWEDDARFAERMKRAKRDQDERQF